jgi:hypothetical protein
MEATMHEQTDRGVLRTVQDAVHGTPHSFDLAAALAESSPDSVVDLDGGRYAREVAEHFGWDGYIAALCACNPEYRGTADRHAQNAYEYARIAWHFARLIEPEAGEVTG